MAMKLQGGLGIARMPQVGLGLGVAEWLQRWPQVAKGPQKQPRAAVMPQMVAT